MAEVLVDLWGHAHLDGFLIMISQSYDFFYWGQLSKQKNEDREWPFVFTHIELTAFGEVFQEHQGAHHLV